MSLLPVGFGASGDDYEITDSLRFRSSASAYLNRTPATAGNRKTWTWSGWVKRGTLGAKQELFQQRDDVNVSQQFGIQFKSDDTIRVLDQSGTTQGLYDTVAVYRDPSAWYHILVSCDTTNATAGDRVKLFVNSERVTAFTAPDDWPLNYDTSVNNTVRVLIGSQRPNSSATLNSFFDGYLTEVNLIDGQALAPTDFGEYDDNGTWKAKKYTGTYGTNGFYLPMKPTTQAELQNTVLYTGDGTSVSVANTGYAPDFVWIKNRDDTNHHRLYDTVRGSQKMLSSSQTAAEQTKTGGLTSFDSDGFSVGNDGSENNSGDDYVAWTWDAGDNQPSTGISSVTYAGNGATQSIKGFGFSPDLVWIKERSSTSSNTLSDAVRGSGNILLSDSTAAEATGQVALTSFNSDGFSIGNDGKTNQSGQTYIAWCWDAGDGDPVLNEVGTIDSTVKANDATGFSIVSVLGQNNTSTLTVGHGLSTTPDMIIGKSRNGVGGWAVWHKDLSSANHTLFLNSTAAESVDGGSPAAAFSAVSSSTITIQNYNRMFGNGVNGILYAFSEVSGVSKFGSYSGTGSAGNAITGLGFKPGFLMIKRTDTTGNWILLDSTRDPFNSVDSSLVADLNNAETANNAAIAVDFNSDGFTIQGTGNGVNNSSGTYIYMAFKGSYSDYVSPLNDTGTIDSRVKANPDKGFSIVSYTGNGTSAGARTVGHGLNTTPSMVIVKSRGATRGWETWFNGFSSSEYIFLNTTAAKTSFSNNWGSTPTSTVFGVNNSNNSNNANEAYIAYCFSEVAGYSKFGSYTGTGSSGKVVTTGFRPAFVMIKRTNVADSWAMFDSTREPVNPIDDLVYANSSAAESTNIYAAIDFTDTGFTVNGIGSTVNNAGGTYIYMAFADTADAVFNFDASGNKNNFDANNINSNAESETTYDLMKDTPSLVDENAGNFATLNPLNEPRPYVTYSDGNLTAINTTSNAHSPFISTIGMAPNSGKYYWESIGVGNSNTRNATGIGTAESMPLTTLPVGFISGQAGFYIGSGTAVYFYDESGTSTFNVAWSAGNVFMHCYDANTGKFWVGQNGVWYNSSGGTTGDPATGANPTATLTSSNTYFPLGTVYNNSGSYLYYNFGQRPFKYTPPTGFLKLNTFNLPDSTIEDGSDYFNTVLYNGNGGTQSIDVGFQSDLVWIKSRNTLTDHSLTDVIRGAGYFLSSNQANTENYFSGEVSAFDAQGFDIGVSARINDASNTYVAWNWLASNTTASNTDGSIPSTVSANTTAGFSIVSYTGTGSAATVGHGLGAAPKMVIVKSRDSSGDWSVYSAILGGTKAIKLNTTAAEITSTRWNNTDSTNSIFNLGSANSTNTSGDDFIAYCFAEVEGYSAFGSYTGNGSADGPFVYTGFRPAFVMVKVTAGAIYDAHWFMLDSARGTYNVNKPFLAANNANAENSGATCADFLSNGFKLRITNSLNDSNATYIYMAFAENPFKNANAR